jgi:hypothetical protein
LTGELYKKKVGTHGRKPALCGKQLSFTIIQQESSTSTIGKEIGSKLEFLVCCLKQIKANILLAHSLWHH